MSDSVDTDVWKIEKYKRRLQHSLSAKFFLRFHVSLVLLAAAGIGWLVDVALLALGLKLIVLRYPLAVLGAYAGFMLGVWVWIEYSGIREYLDSKKSEELIGEDVPEADREGHNPVHWIDVLQLGSLWDLLIIPAVVIFLCALLFYFLGGYLVVTAPGFMAEIVFELLVASGLVRGLLRVEESGWVLGVLNATFWPLIFSLGVALAIGAVAFKYFPDAATLSQILLK